MIFDGFSEYGHREFIAFGEYSEGTPADISLKALLNLGDENLKPFAKNILDSNELPEDLQELLKELTRGIRAFSQFQDILDVSLDIDDHYIINRHYAYFESLVYIREGVVSWLDRNVLAALTLLRPFLELAILHLFWFLRCRRKSYKPYYEWLKHDKGKPPFQNALNYVFDNLPSKGWVNEKRLQELKQVILNAYKTLCAYNHTPNIKDSITAKSGGLGNVALESFFYYLHITNILLHQVVYLFILAYPMSLFPVERHKKWGFSGPVGLFFDNANYALLEIYIGSDNISSLKQSLSSIPDVISLMEWFNSFPDLTFQETDADWEQLENEVSGLKKENVKDLRQRLALMKSFNRSLDWALNYVVDSTQDNNIPDEVIENLRKRIRTW